MCKGTFFQNLMKIIIVILCVYIGVRCVSIMTKEDIKDQTGNVINDASDIIVKELVENGDVMKQYMLYIENHKSLSTAAKKKVLNEIVSEYIAKSEYTYNIDDPGYKQVINLLSENPENISLFDIISSTEVTMKINRCLEEDGFCSRNATDYCSVHKAFLKVQKIYEDSLRAVRISDMIE